MTAQEGIAHDLTVAAARLWAADRFPYLASALFALDITEVPGLGGVQVDEWWRLAVDPELAVGWSSAQLGAELVHSTVHLLRDHAERARQAGVVEPAAVAHWVDSTDAEIADDLPPEFERARPVVTPADLDVRTGGLAEGYWRTATPRRIVEGGSEGGARGVLEPVCDCGSGAHGRPAGWEPPPPADGGSGIDREQQQLLRQKVAGDVAAAGARAPSGLRRWAESWGRPELDWRRLLAGELQRSLLAAQGAVDYSYARPSRRSASTPGVVLASLRSPEVVVAVVVDTSASVTDSELSLALAEIDGLLSTTGIRDVRVVACDDTVHSVQVVRRVGDVELFGGSGTDLGAGLEAAVDGTHPPALVVVVTDGYTPWPDHPPSGRGRVPRVIVARLGGSASGTSTARPDSPPWASVIDIDVAS